MVNGTEYNLKNQYADSVKDFHKRVIAPFGMNMSFVPIVDGTLIYTGNIVSIRELADKELSLLESMNRVVGLTETNVEVENIEEDNDEPATEEASTEAGE